MRCTSCDYRLWNLASRNCPECGQPFRPSAYRFIPSSVQFCCPHCGQDYYGTREDGQLDPPAFTCVRCQRAIHVDHMVLLPTAGLEEAQTAADRINPWLDPQGGFWRRWFRTVGMALFQPRKLLTGTPPSSSLQRAIEFHAWAICGLACFTLIPLYLLMAMLMLAFGAGTPLGAVVVGLLMLPVVVLVSMGGLLGWALLTTLSLRWGSRSTVSVQRTFQSFCYASGACMASAVPVLGWYFGWVWWLVSSIEAVRAAHGVSMPRAALAVGAWPLLAVVGLGVACNLQRPTYVMFPLPARSADSARVDRLTQLVLTHGWQSDGSPRLALELLASGAIALHELQRSSAADLSLAMVSDTDLLALEALEALDPDRSAAAMKQVRRSAPPNPVAERLADFVFTHHALRPARADQQLLWLVVGLPASDPGSPFLVGRVNSLTSEIAPEDFAAALAEQNRLREAAGVPPLPDLTTLRAGELAASPAP